MQNQSTTTRIQTPLVTQQCISQQACPPPPRAVKCKWPKGSFSLPAPAGMPLQKRTSTAESDIDRPLRRRPRDVVSNTEISNQDLVDRIQEINDILGFLPPPPLYMQTAPSQTSAQMPTKAPSARPIRKLGRESSLKRSITAKSA